MDKEKELARNRKYHRDHRDELIVKMRDKYAAKKSEYSAKSKLYYKAHREKLMSKFKEYYKANSEKILFQQKDYSEKNREKISAQKKAYNRSHIDEKKSRDKNYRQSHPEKIATNKMAYHEAHRAEWNERNKAYNKAHPEIKRERDKARKLIKTKAMPPWADRAAIRVIYAKAEALTRETGIKHHVDHLYPLRGNGFNGLHVHWNLQVLTAAQNLAKGNRLCSPL